MGSAVEQIKSQQGAGLLCSGWPWGFLPETEAFGTKIQKTVHAGGGSHKGLTTPTLGVWDTPI